MDANQLPDWYDKNAPVIQSILVVREGDREACGSLQIMSVDKYDAVSPLKGLEVLHSLGLGPVLFPISLSTSMPETSELSCCAGSSSTAFISSSVDLADCGVCDDRSCGG